MNPGRVLFLLALLPLVAYGATLAADFVELQRFDASRVEQAELDALVNELAYTVMDHREDLVIHRWTGEAWAGGDESVPPTRQRVERAIGAIDERLESKAHLDAHVPFWRRWRDTYLGVIDDDGFGPRAQFTAITRLLAQLDGIFPQSLIDDTPPLDRRRPPSSLLGRGSAHLQRGFAHPQRGFAHLENGSAIRIVNLVGQLRAMKALAGLGGEARGITTVIDVDLDRALELAEQSVAAGHAAPGLIESIGDLRAQIFELEALPEVSGSREEAWRRFALGGTVVDKAMATTRALRDARRAADRAHVEAERGRLAGSALLTGLVGFCLVVGFVLIGRAESQRAFAAEQLQLAAEGLGLGIAIENLRTGERYWSEELREILGLESDAPIDPARVRMAGTDLEIVREAVRRLMAEPVDSAGRRETLEVRLIRSDEQLRWARIAFSKLRDSSGDPVIVAITQDIDDEVRTRGELGAAFSQLEEQNESLRHFARATAHDLLEPIRMVRSFAVLLEEELGDDLDAERGQLLGFLIEGAERASTTLERLQVYLSIGRFGELRPVELGGVVEDLLADLRPTIEATGARISVEALPVVFGEPHALSSAFRNLLTNALKYTEPGTPPRIRISSTRSGGFCDIVVADEGIGIPEERLDEVFEPFKRLHTRRAYPGTGLGLSICRRAIDQCGGQIFVESEVGRGTRFQVRLRASESRDGSPVVRGEAPETPRTAWPTSERPKPDEVSAE